MFSFDIGRVVKSLEHGILPEIYSRGKDDQALYNLLKTVNQGESISLDPLWIVF